MWVLTLQRLGVQFFLDILYFPFWWYSIGAARSWRTFLLFVKEGNEQFVPFLWMKHIFTPMFGQTDWQGRIMSVFMRIVNIIFRLIALLLWTCVIFACFVCWLSLPIVLLTLVVRILFA